MMISLQSVAQKLSSIIHTLNKRFTSQLNKDKIFVKNMSQRCQNEGIKKIKHTSSLSATLGGLNLT